MFSMPAPGRENGAVVTAGGRVLAVTALGRDVSRRPARAPTKRSRRSISKAVITAGILLSARLRDNIGTTDVPPRLLLHFRSLRSLGRGGEFDRAIARQAERVSRPRAICHRRRLRPRRRRRPARTLIDSMDPADLKEAIQLLKNNYIKPEALNETELSRATFEGILTRLGRGVVLLRRFRSGTGRTGGAVLSARFWKATLVIFGSARSPGPNLDALDANLQTFAAKKVDAVVLDLRASPATNDFATGRRVREAFLSERKTALQLRKTTAKQERTFTSDRDPAYQGLTIVLADGDTAGAAEAIAGRDSTL